MPLDLGNLRKVAMGCGLAELTGKSINIKFTLPFLKWIMPVIPKCESETLPKFGSV